MNQPTSGKPLTAEQRQALEATHTWQRVAELYLDPVRGNFDAAHLMEINRRIFQDLPALGFEDVTPGQFRPAVAEGNDWTKTRKLETVDVPSHVAYSRMDDDALSRLASTLGDIDPDELGKLGTEDFTRALGTLYTRLDYIHPFGDGNSRTLREFTRELAHASGYSLEWEHFGKSAAGRDLLYIARDLCVNEHALPFVQHDGTKRDVMLSMDQFEGNRTLPDLLRDVVRPTRAIAFEQLSEAEAIRRHGELAEAFRTMRAAAEYFEAKVPGDTGAQSSALQTIRKHVQAKLDQGETKDFRKPPSEQQHRSKSPEQTTRSEIDNSDRER